MEDIMEMITVLLIVVGLCVVLPIMIVWITNKRKKEELEKKSEILMTLLEKKTDMDPTEVLKTLDMSEKKKKTVKQELLERLMGGCILSLIGLVLLITHLCNFIFFGTKTNGIIFGGVMIAVGIAMLVYYFVGKKMLKKEIDAEEKQLTEQ
ncbi:MAG: hypothetical protein K6A41_00595 [Bacteroidales bacterium]|nr:hypothetical protein [Bacteroidales bacterium]